MSGNSDNSAAGTYHGTGLTVAAWQRRAEAQNAQPEQDDLTTQVDHDTELAGRDGQGYGREVGSTVPNLAVEHHSRPAKTRSLPDSYRTDQNPLGRPHGRRGQRGR
jgi:hypothetical protein